MILLRLATALPILLLWASCPAPAEVSYRPVSPTDLLQGYVTTGETIEVEGHAWVVGSEVFFNASRVSAQFPARLDVSEIEAGIRDRLAAQCAAANQFAGGCSVRVRGRVGNREPNRRSVLVAAELQLP